MQSLLGIVVLSAVAWRLSENRRAIPWRVVVTGLALQFALALLLLKVPFIKVVLLSLNSVVLAIDKATQAGAGFVFGYLAGAQTPFEISTPQATFILAFRALPIILVVSALSAVLFYWRILPFIIQLFSQLLRKTMGISGALGLGSAANVFIGMVEAPLIIRPYLTTLTRGELFGLMTVGMATIAGTVMVLYASLLAETIPNALGHILVASVISAPAALYIAAVIVPFDTKKVASAQPALPQQAHSSMDAITQGTMQGLQLYLNIIAMLIVFVALVELVNMGLTVLPDYQQQPISLQRLLGWLMAPVVWLIGIPWSEAATAGQLMGIKTVLNEFLAYIQLSQLQPGQLGQRSQLIMTYALCGFANFGSLGIMIGGLTLMVPDRRNEIAGLGMKSIVAGTLSTLLTGAVVAVVIP